MKMIIFFYKSLQLSEDLQSGIFFFGMSNSLINPLIYGAFHLWPIKKRKRFQYTHTRYSTFSFWKISQSIFFSPLPPTEKDQLYYIEVYQQMLQYITIIMVITTGIWILTENSQTLTLPRRYHWCRWKRNWKIWMKMWIMSARKPQSKRNSWTSRGYSTRIVQ